MKKIITLFLGIVFLFFSVHASHATLADSDSVKIYQMNSAMFIPDGPYCVFGNPCLYSTILVNDFSEKDSIKDVNDILSLCMNIEHSFPGDLGMSLVCPNGKQVSLMTYNGAEDRSREYGIPPSRAPYNGGAYLGIAGRPDNGCDPRNNPPCIGWNYCWSEAYMDSSRGSIGPHTRQMWSPIDSTDYKNKQGFFTPDNSFSNFIGCPMNGEWKLVICDYRAFDNGWLFNWSIGLNTRCKLPQDFALESVGETNAIFTYENSDNLYPKLIYRKTSENFWKEASSVTEISELQPGTNYIAKITCVGIDSPLDKSEGKTIYFKTIPLPPCGAISNLNIDLSETHAKFTLNSYPLNFKSWRITYKNADSSDTDSKTIYSDTRSILATKIDYHYVYEVKARTVCEKNESIDTLFYVGGNYFPEKMHVYDIMDTNASVFWRVNKTIGYYIFEYCKKENIATKDDENWISKIAFQSPLTLSNLAPETTYRLKGITFDKESGLERTEEIEFTTLKNTLNTENTNFFGEKILLYPNPAKDFVLINTIGLEGNIKIEILNIQGKVLQNRTIACQGNQEHKLMLGKLPAGVYSIRFTQNNKSEIRKIVIQ